MSSQNYSLSRGIAIEPGAGETGTISVFLICSGLGHVNRGYESFTQECFEALSGVPNLDLTLFKGGGRSEDRQIVLWNLPRSQPFCAWLGKKVGKSGYWVEQVTFTLSLLPHLLRQKPAVIYLSDTNIGNLLWHWRRLTKQNYKILFSNGGPMQPPYPRWDFVQQLTPTHREMALASGYPASQQVLLPYGIAAEPELPALSSLERDELRASLGLPAARPVVLSVGAVNLRHKRMDYVIREVAALPEPRPFLVLLGQTDEETPTVRMLADSLLGTGQFQIATVAHREVESYYRVADAFVLASLNEGFGRVFLEAMSYGLPCLAHAYAITRFVLGEQGWLSDFTQTGTLTGLLQKLLNEGDLPGARAARHHYLFGTFSWQTLAPQYAEMLRNAACPSRKVA